MVTKRIQDQKQKSSPPQATFLSDNPSDNSLFLGILSNSPILLSLMIVQVPRSSGIGVYEFPGQWTILFRGTGFWAVLEGWEEGMEDCLKPYSPLSILSLVLLASFFC